MELHALTLAAHSYALLIPVRLKNDEAANILIHHI